MKTPGQIAYEAYCGASHWKSLMTGASLPAWEQVRQDIQAAWERGSAAVLRQQGVRKDELLCEARMSMLNVVGGTGTKKELAAVDKVTGAISHRLKSSRCCKKWFSP
jgi:hypothetical protein